MLKIWIHWNEQGGLTSGGTEKLRVQTLSPEWTENNDFEMNLNLVLKFDDIMTLTPEWTKNNDFEIMIFWFWNLKFDDINYDVIIR